MSLLSNSTLLGFCNTFASIFDSILGLFSPVLGTFGIVLPTVSSICTSLFGAG